jgi:PEGA domain-containing protein
LATLFDGATDWGGRTKPPSPRSTSLSLHRRVFNRREHLIEVLIFCVASLLAPARAQQVTERLSKAQILDLLKKGVPSSQIEAMVHKLKVSFCITSETEVELRKAGAKDRLVQAIWKSGPPQPPPLPRPPPPVIIIIETNPGGVAVYIDGKEVGTTDSKGRLERPQFETGEHKIRLIAEGYRDYEQTVDLVPGQTYRITRRLELLTAALRPLSAGPIEASFSVSHQHTMGFCSGVLKIGGGRIQYAPAKGSDSFDFPVSDIKQWGNAMGGGFFLKFNNGKRYFFLRSSSTSAVLNAIQAAKHSQ